MPEAGTEMSKTLPKLLGILAQNLAVTENPYREKLIVT